MVVFSGGKASGFKNITDHDTYDEGIQLRDECNEQMW